MITEKVKICKFHFDGIVNCCPAKLFKAITIQNKMNFIFNFFGGAVLIDDIFVNLRVSSESNVFQIQFSGYDYSCSNFG